VLLTGVSLVQIGIKPGDSPEITLGCGVAMSLVVAPRFMFVFSISP